MVDHAEKTAKALLVGRTSQKVVVSDRVTDSAQAAMEGARFAELVVEAVDWSGPSSRSPVPVLGVVHT
jgi:hypothetical protein